MRLITAASLCILFVFAVGCQKDKEVSSFEECVAAGFPVMESYPRQCAADGITFTEELNGEAEFLQCTDMPEVCTMQFDPVCGIADNGIRCITTPCQSTDAVDFGNSCMACSAGAYGYYQGECSKNLFVVCGKTVTGFDPSQYARDAGGICVDICPGNYDAYMTQIGIELCIPHYGEDEILGWEECTRSSEECNCVKAYETTRDETIDDPKYRCVPAMYAERLLFRGGQDRLDEDGQQGVLIA